MRGYDFPSLHAPQNFRCCVICGNVVVVIGGAVINASGVLNTRQPRNHSTELLSGIKFQQYIAWLTVMKIFKMEIWYDNNKLLILVIL